VSGRPVSISSLEFIRLLKAIYLSYLLRKQRRYIDARKIYKKQANVQRVRNDRDSLQKKMSRNGRTRGEIYGVLHGTVYELRSTALILHIRRTCNQLLINTSASMCVELIVSFCI